MKSAFIQWYSERVAEQLNADTAVESVSVSLQMSLVKPLSGNWFINAFSTHPDIIFSGFKAAGILDIFNMD